MSDYKPFWVDRKLDMIIEFLVQEPWECDADAIVEDLRICHDQAREFYELFPGDISLYRMRSNKILVAVGAMKRSPMVEGKAREYLEALEGVLLGVLRTAG